MKSLIIFNTPEELETIKTRVRSGEQIYTVIDGVTVFLEFNLAEDTIKKIVISKADLNALFLLFPIDGESAPMTEEEPEIYPEYMGRLIDCEFKIKAIEEALSAPILKLTAKKEE